MKLRDLLRGIPVKKINVSEELDIPAVAYDSRKVTPGCLFAAITGFASDGNRFIPMALDKGAAVVVTAKEPDTDIPFVLVEDDRKALAMLGVNFYGEPAKSMTMIGVTGTNGKTSVTLLLKQLLEKTKGARVGLLGTVSNMIGSAVIPTERTTPESFELQGLLAEMRDAGCDTCVMEVSSHAIALHRIWGIHYDVAAFTNLTEDHLDFHKTMEAYAETKAELFARCDKAVLTGDDPYLPVMTQKLTAPAILTGKDLICENALLESDRVSFTACFQGEKADVNLPIPGKFTLSNALTVLGIALQLGISLSESADALKTVSGVKGRVEVVPTPAQPYTILIDYAHTPDGLSNVLSSVKGFCRGKVIAVFGCGGDRDPMKRPIMGEIGTRIADFAVITSDNPRTEDPFAILRDIEKGIPEDRKNYAVVENRKKAIAFAMDMAKKYDIIVLAGKGHETYQEIGGVKHHLDERELVAEILAETR